MKRLFKLAGLAILIFGFWYMALSDGSCAKWKKDWAEATKDAPEVFDALKDAVKKDTIAQEIIKDVKESADPKKVGQKIGEGARWTKDNVVDPGIDYIKDAGESAVDEYYGEDED